MTLTLRLLVALGFASAALLTAPRAVAEGDPAAGKTKFETCRGCHAVPSYTNAFPMYHVPMVAGQHATRVVAALQAYKSGERSHPTMIAQAASLTDQDMQDIGAYLAAGKAEFTVNPPPGPAPEKAAVCAACHGKDGVSPSPEFPILAGQHRDYLARALLDYRSGARKNGIMAAQAAQLTDAEIAEISRWYAKQASPLRTVR
jgi:cytochrome c553